MAADACDDGNGIILTGTLLFDFGFDPSSRKVSAILFTYQNRYDKLSYICNKQNDEAIDFSKMVTLSIFHAKISNSHYFRINEIYIFMVLHPFLSTSLNDVINTQSEPICSMEVYSQPHNGKTKRALCFCLGKIFNCIYKLCIIYTMYSMCIVYCVLCIF